MGGCVIVEATTGSSTELLPCSRASYAHSIFRADDELKSFRFCLKWMCVNQFDARHVMISLSIFLLLGVFVHTTFHSVLSCALACCAYDVMVGEVLVRIEASVVVVGDVVACALELMSDIW